MPRYLNLSTSSKEYSPILISPTPTFFPNIIILVLLWFSFKPISLPSSRISPNMSFIIFLLFVTITISSAYTIICPPLVLSVPLFILLTTYSRARLNSMADSESPCLTPLLTSNSSVTPFCVFILTVVRSIVICQRHHEFSSIYRIECLLEVNEQHLYLHPKLIGLLHY